MNPTSGELVTVALSLSWMALAVAGPVVNFGVLRSQFDQRPTGEFKTSPLVDGNAGRADSLPSALGRPPYVLRLASLVLEAYLDLRTILDNVAVLVQRYVKLADFGDA